jgi:hypothetical protein
MRARNTLLAKVCYLTGSECATDSSMASPRKVWQASRRRTPQACIDDGNLLRICSGKKSKIPAQKRGVRMMRAKQSLRTEESADRASLAGALSARSTRSLVRISTDTTHRLFRSVRSE